MVTESTENRVLVFFDSGTRRRGYYPQSGLVLVFVWFRAADVAEFRARVETACRIVSYRVVVGRHLARSSGLRHGPCTPTVDIADEA